MRKLYILFLFVLVSSFVFSQNEIPIVEELGDDSNEAVDKTFPTIQIYNFPTTDVLPKGDMKLYLAHRMGQVGTGIDGLFGLYTANSRIGADLGLTKNITIGLGSTSQQKLYDGYIKALLVRQCKEKSPVSVGFFTDATISLQERNYPDEETYTWQKMTYTSELMISKLFTDNFAAQLMFATVHKNMVASRNDRNTIWATGLAANYKIGRKWYLAFEYVYLPKDQIKSVKAKEHILSVGVQIHTGPRHVFQIFLSNSGGINENTVLTETTDKFRFKKIRLCFNIPTTFKLFN